MSLVLIRRALEKKLALLTPALATAFENAVYSPVTGTPYQKVNLLPATPDNSTMGSLTYMERGIFQVTLCYPVGVGPAAAETQAQLLRAHFKRGTSLAESGVTVIVTDTPRAAPALIEGDRHTIPISIAWQCQITT